MQYAEILIDFSGAPAGSGDFISFTSDGNVYTIDYSTPPLPTTAEESADYYNLRLSLALPSGQYLVSKVSATRVSVKAQYYGDRWNFSSIVISTNASLFSNVSNVTEAMSTSAAITQNTCLGLETGEIDLTIIGGEWPFSIEWRVQGNPTVIASTEDLSGLAAGFYEVTVTDAQATEVVDVYEVTEPATATSVTPTITDSTCFGANNGEISLVVSGGTAPYTYEWSHGPTTKDVTGLAPGNYSVTVTDDVGCQKVVNNLVVNEPAQIVIEATIFGFSISLNVTGGIPPYSYLWGDGPTTKDRNGLSAGTYSVTVTDANGCTSAADITISALRYFFSHNPIPLVLLADAPETKANLSFINEVWVEDVYLSDSFAKISTEEHPSNADGGTVFRGETFLDAYLKGYVPAPGLAEITRCDSLFKRFYFRHTEKFGTPPVEDDYIQVDTNFVVLGGLSDTEYAAGNFDSYLDSVMPFMTWEVDKKVLPGQPDYLYFMVQDSATTLLKLMVELTFTDGTTQEVEKYVKTGISNPFEVYCFPVGYGQLGLGSYQPGKKVESYKVWLEDQLNARISEERIYTVDWRYFPYIRYLMYQSALGGMSTIALTGKATKTVEVSQELIDKFLPYDFTVDDLGEKISFSSGRPMIKFSSGFITNERYFQRLEDLIRSEAYYLYDDSGSNARWLPVRVQADRTPVYDETRQDALNVLKGTIYLHEDRKYTPSL